MSSHLAGLLSVFLGAPPGNEKGLGWLWFSNLDTSSQLWIAGCYLVQLGSRKQLITELGKVEMYSL